MDIPHSQTPSSAAAISLHEDDEGGLNVGQVLSALRRQIFLIAGITTVVASAAVLKSLTDAPTYFAKFEMLTESVTVEGELTSSIPQTLSSRENGSRLVIDETKLRVLTSPRVIDPIVEQLRDRYPDISYATIVGNLSIVMAGQTNILEVAYQNDDPARVTAVLNAVSQAFLEYSLQSRQSNVRKAIDFVEAQLPEQGDRVDALQQELQDLRQRHDLIDPASRGQQLSGQLSSFAQAKLEIELQLKDAQALYTDLQNQMRGGSNEAAASSALSQNGRYQAILNQILAVDSEIAQSSVLLLEDSPDIQLLIDQRQNLLGLLQREGLQAQSEVASQIRALEARNQALGQTIEALNSNIKELSVISREYTDLQRELQIATENLNQFLSKREALRIDAAQREVPWELLKPPSFPQPSSASVKRNAVLGTLLGLLLGIGGALLIEKFRNILHTSKDIKDITKLPLLGTIPYNELLAESEVGKNLAGLLQQADQSFQLSPAATLSYSATPFSEAFRSLYANICLLNPDRRVRSLVVSSSVPTDGKSTVATYLAQAAAAMGQRVLIVDTDLRRPQLHHHFNLNNVKGMVDVISDNLEPDDVIQPVPSGNNLFVLTTGNVPPDPARILSSQRMHRIMVQLRENFDLVIYDTPPLLGFSDPFLLTPQTDGMVLVVGLGKLKRFLLEQALEQLQVSGVSVLGVVANGSRDYTSSLNGYYDRYYQEPTIIDIASSSQAVQNSLIN